MTKKEQFITTINRLTEQQAFELLELLKSFHFDVEATIEFLQAEALKKEDK